MTTAPCGMLYGLLTVAVAAFALITVGARTKRRRVQRLCLIAALALVIADIAIGGIFYRVDRSGDPLASKSSLLDWLKRL
jgi:heme A synthase